VGSLTSHNSIGLHGLLQLELYLFLGNLLVALKHIGAVKSKEVKGEGILGSLSVREMCLLKGIEQ
jgi:hypothetical protein